MKILVISNSFVLSGAETSLIQYLKELNTLNVKILIVLPKNSQYKQLLSANCEIIFLPFIWFVKSLNPFYLVRCLLNIIYCSFRLRKIILYKRIDIVYSNSIKSHIYSILIKLLTDKKIIWHVRDNLKNNLLTKFLIKTSDKIICISEHIYSQLKAPINKKVLIYGGIDVNEWQSLNNKNNLRASIGLLPETKIIAQIGQITCWKNHFDFIKVASIIIKFIENVHFLVVGDDLTGKEKNYKKQIETKILKAGLEKHFSFLGFIQDIKQIYSQIDILVHPAIDEPFGRVVIEAMTMEKPVVAYDCGGPKEIIVNNQTGYLVEPYDYKTIAEKVVLLLKDNKLQIQFGKAGRKKVIEKFNIKEQISKMKALLDSM